MGETRGGGEMTGRYEFAELSFDKSPGDVLKLGCNFALLDRPSDDPNMGEVHYTESWVDVLPKLGADGWHIGGMMEYGLLRSILLQRRMDT